MHNDKQERFMLALKPILPNIERFIRALVMTDKYIPQAHQMAQDICAETIVRAFERFDSLRHPEALLSYCFTVASRLYRKENAQYRKFTAFDTDVHSNLDLAHEQSSDAATQDSTEVALLYAALNKLPDKQREALIMFELLDCSLKEILAVQGGTMIALKVRLSRGRAELKRLLMPSQKVYAQQHYHLQYQPPTQEDSAHTELHGFVL